MKEGDAFMMGRRTRIAALILLLAAAAIAALAETGRGKLEPKSLAAAVAPRSLPGAYVDAAQQNIPFGDRSYYLAPWRSYMDTRDAPGFLSSLAVNYDNQVSGRPEYADATVHALRGAGFRAVRLEIPWSDFQFGDDSKLTPEAERRYGAALAAFKKYGLRPLILLNANAGLPAPYQTFTVNVTRDAPAGQREIDVDPTDLALIKPGYTGLQHQKAYSMYPVITAVDAATGKLTLSDRLQSGVKKGRLELIRLKYQPFSAGKVFKDGRPNPAAQETIDGWLKYVASVGRFVKSKVGTPSDAGFDFEVWNELSFGSEFLNLEQNHYYNPAPEYAPGSEISYTENGRTLTGAEVIVPLTANFVKNAASGLPGVKVISGFSNQRPWDSGASLWDGLDGYSRHYYAGYLPDTGVLNTSIISPETERIKPGNLLNAAGQPDRYAPRHVAAFPEYWWNAYMTEYLGRDTQPFPGPMVGEEQHFRYANDGDGRQAEVWMTETNFVRENFVRELMAKAGLKSPTPELSNLIHRIQAKALLRLHLFNQHKGIEKTFSFAVHFDGDLNYAIIPDAFFRALDMNGYRYDAVRSLAGPQLQAMGNLARFMEQGEPIATPRKLNVDRIVELDPRPVFEGDGTAQNPTRYQAEDLAILPYQFNDRTFAIGYYVMTRDLTRSWNSSKGLLDPARYEMPDAAFEVTLSNIAGQGAAVSVFDPMTGSTEPVTVVGASGQTLTVRISASDYPRFLVVEEAAAHPLIRQVELRKTDGGATLAFQPNLSGSVRVSWGPYPIRSTGAVSVQHYPHYDPDLARPDETGSAQGFHFKNSLGEAGNANGYFRITGKIRPKYSETYTFEFTGETCHVRLTIGGRRLIDQLDAPACTGGLQGSMELAADTDYSIELVSAYSNAGSPHSQSLYWSSRSQPFGVVPPKPDGAGEKMVQVARSGETVQVSLPGMKVGDGVRLEMSSGGIAFQYPQWDYDVRGVLYTVMPPRGDEGGGGSPGGVAGGSDGGALGGFPDVPAGHWAAGAIERARAAGWIHGDPDGRFHPERAVTRGEFAVMVALATGSGETAADAELPFRDVGAQDWYTPYVAYVYAQGIVSGVSATAFAPNRPIARQEIAAMITRAFELKAAGDAAVTYADADRIADWAQDAVDRLSRAGVLHGYPDGTVRPGLPATRAEVALILTEAARNAGLLP
jgi:hypothetical protein